MGYAGPIERIAAGHFEPFVEPLGDSAQQSTKTAKNVLQDIPKRYARGNCRNFHTIHFFPYRIFIKG